MIKSLNMMFNSKKIILGFVFIFLASSVFASSVTCTLSDDKVFVEVEIDDGVEIIFPEEYSLLENNDGVMSFFSRDYIRKSGHEMVFIFPKIIDSVYDLSVYLPKNYILSDSLVYPKGYELSTNGRNIILDWDSFAEDEVVVFYEGNLDSNFLFYIIFVFLIGLASWAFYFQWGKFRKKMFEIKSKSNRFASKLKQTKKKNVTRNLFGDEKAIVDYLLTKKNKECRTKELTKEIGISKVRLSRKVRSLVKKGLVEKEKLGNENKISLK